MQSWYSNAIGGDHRWNIVCFYDYLMREICIEHKETFNLTATLSVSHIVFFYRIKPFKTALGASGKVPERPKYTGSESSRMCASSFRLTYISSST